MSPTAVHLLKVADETLANVKFRDWTLEAGEVEGSVYVRAVPALGSGLKPSKMIFLGERSGRLDVVRVAHDAVRNALMNQADDEFAWKGHLPFARY